MMYGRSEAISSSRILRIDPSVSTSATWFGRRLYAVRPWQGGASPNQIEASEEIRGERERVELVKVVGVVWLCRDVYAGHVHRRAVQATRCTTGTAEQIEHPEAIPYH